jgi:hypothetical protein
MAELVDALVSNTNGSNTVPVRLRLRVQKPQKISEAFLFHDGTERETEVHPDALIRHTFPGQHEPQNFHPDNFHADALVARVGHATGKFTPG